MEVWEQITGDRWGNRGDIGVGQRKQGALDHISQVGNV